MLDRDDPLPLSRQLAALIRGEIESGKRPPRSRLPSINALAAEHDIATATVVKALRILKEDGLVTGTPGHGTFVADR
jgi:DNA-binding GntR family transcriptional regulator